jgi:hypothetical protein
LARIGVTVSLTEARLAYLLLKCGLLLSNPGFFSSACAFARALASSALLVLAINHVS